jgi:hypothetical protein
MHFTRVEHLKSIIAGGLLSDSRARHAGATQVEVGHPAIKERRRGLPVPVAPGGFVGDYVPFYFAERSPMMYTLHRGNVETYQDGFDRVIYLVSSLQVLTDIGCAWIASDRNAAHSLAAFAEATDDLGDFIDWPLMRAMQWGWCQEDPERPDRRAAECLVHDSVPWSAFTEVVAKTEACAAEARLAIAAAGSRTPVTVRRDWYF